jgi:hypothetical protein
LTSVPYLVAPALIPSGSHYTGLLINPIDGHSYLAKMAQGATGSWLFRLPYTAEPHQPALLYTYYLALGHLVPSGSPIVLVLVYHVARILSGLALLLVTYGASSFLTSHIRARRFTVLLVGLSSGMGWIFGVGPDLTVPESITFPSLLVNAHFPLTAMLILLLLLALSMAKGQARWCLVIAVGSVLLTMIQPLASLVVGLVGLVWFLGSSWRAQTVQRPLLTRLVAFSIGSIPLVIYMLRLFRSNPFFRQWMEQNVTPSPALWQWLIGYGLLTPLALVGARRSLRRQSDMDRLLLIWVGIQGVLILVPISLQRRLSTGLHLPLCFLATIGVWEVILPRFQNLGLPVLALLLLLFPSNLLLMTAGVSAAASGNPYLVVSDAEWRALQWLRENAPPDSVVLTDPEMGTLVPGWTGGLRVLYGHPFETPDAESMEAMVSAFFAGEMSRAQRQDLVDRWSVQFMLIRNSSSEGMGLPGFHLIWQDGGVVILQRSRS